MNPYDILEDGSCVEAVNDRLALRPLDIGVKANDTFVKLMSGARLGSGSVISDTPGNLRVTGMRIKVFNGAQVHIIGVVGATDTDVVVDGRVGVGIQVAPPPPSPFGPFNVLRTRVTIQEAGVTDFISVQETAIDTDVQIAGTVNNVMQIIGATRTRVTVQNTAEVALIGVLPSRLPRNTAAATDTDLIIDGAVDNINVDDAIRTGIILGNGGIIGDSIDVNRSPSTVNGGTDANLIIDGSVSNAVNVNGAIRTSINVQSGGNVLGLGINVNFPSINTTVMVKGNVSSIQIRSNKAAVTILKGGTIGDLACGGPGWSIDVSPSAMDATVIVEGGGEVVCPIEVRDSFSGTGARLVEVKEGAKTDIIRVIPDGTQTITIAARATVRGIQVCPAAFPGASVLCNGETLEAPSGFPCDNYDQACQAT
jgi:hypothetical protein